MSVDYLLQVKDLYVSYNNNPVLNGLNLNLERGEVRAILGQNAAGKTTLIKCIMGQIPCQSGDIIFDGENINNQPRTKRIQHRIYSVDQDVMLFDNLSVAENIFFDSLPFIYSQSTLKKRYQRLKEHFSFNFDGSRFLGTLNAAQKKLVQMLKGYVSDAQLLILDEPTARFTIKETELVFDMVRELKKAGKSILYVTHRREDAYAIADNISVLYDGFVQETVKANIEQDENIIKLLTGNNTKNRYPKLYTEKGSPLLTIRDISSKNVKNFNLTLYGGEIVAVTGLVGAGKTELARTLVGKKRARNGHVYSNKNRKFITDSVTAMSCGIGYVSEDWTDNLCDNISGYENIALTNFEKSSKKWFVDFSSQKKIAEGYYERLVVRKDVESFPGEMSGGEKQKLSLARMLNGDVDVMIIDEPTLCVDIPSKVDVYNIFNDFVSKNKSLIIMTSDISEACGIADRVIILKSGVVVAEFTHNLISEQLALTHLI